MTGDVVPCLDVSHNALPQLELIVAEPPDYYILWSYKNLDKHAFEQGFHDQILVQHARDAIFVTNFASRYHTMVQGLDVHFRGRFCDVQGFRVGHSCPGVVCAQQVLKTSSNLE